jgi:hypothetical protein
VGGKQDKFYSCFAFIMEKNNRRKEFDLSKKVVAKLKFVP